jgi:DNA replication factor GINS
MNLDELRSVRRTERQKDSLQHLRDSFYEDVAAYIAERKAERQRAAEQAADPFADPEVGQLTDEIETAEDVVESIYERRVGKVVKLASFAAADMSADTDGLTAEEKALFDDLVARIKQSRGTVLDVLSGEGENATPDGTQAVTGDAPAPASSSQEPAPAEYSDPTPPAPSTPSPSEANAAETPETSASTTEPSNPQSHETGADVDAPTPSGATAPDDVLAEAMGATDADSADADSSADDSTGRESSGPSPDVPPDAPPDAAAQDAPVVESVGDGRNGDGDDREPDGGVVGAAPVPEHADAAPESAATQSVHAGPSDSSETDDADRVTLRITEDVGQIFGVDEREYDLASEDVVTLPSTNAGPLLDRDAAERLD